MASTYSDLKIELIGTGEQVGTWGATTNTNLGTALEEAITGSADVSFSSTDVTLTLTNTNGTQTARNLRLVCTGTSGGARNLILGSGCQIEKLYLIQNDLADTVTVKNTTGAGVAVASGARTFVFNDGTHVVAATNLTGISGTLPVTNGGTGQTSYTNGQLLIGNTTGNTLTKATLTGTTNRLTVTNGTGSITLNVDATNANTANKVVARDGSGNFSAGTITANLTGNVTGNVTGSSGSTTGNAATATALQNARTIGGVSFNGTANINLPGVNTAGNQNTSGNATSATNATNSNNVNIAATSSSDTSTYPMLVGNLSTGNQGPFIDSGLSYNASTNALTAAAFIGALTGNASTVTNGVYTTNFTGSNQSLAASGWQKFPGGLVLQWGEVTGANVTAPQTITFPTTFPNACLFVLVQYQGISDVTQGFGYGYIKVTSKSTTSFTTAYSGGKLWVAIGY
jgi:hypothetical protein